MGKGYLLAIDAGTGSGRAVLFDTKGNQVAVGQEEWSHAGEEGVPGAMNFDWEAGWKLLAKCIKKALKKAEVKPKQVLGVSATSMREGIVLYDEAGKELWAVANVDARADKQVAELKQWFPELEREHYRLSGQTFALGALPRLLWVKEHKPELYEKTARLSMISDWALARLSGEITSDPSNAGTTGIFSLETRDWAPELAEKAGLKSGIYPKCVEPGTVIGGVTKAAAKATGLAEGTPVVMGGGDVQLGSVGLGVVEPGQGAVLGGTFWQQIVNVEGALEDPEMELRINPHVIPGQSQAEGITFFTGLTMRWFRDAFCAEEKRKAKRKGMDPYALLEEMAKEVPAGSRGIIPVTSDRMKYGRWYHAAPSLLNLSIDPEKCNKASLFRALEENAAIVSNANIEKIETLTGVSPEILVFAGGGSKGKLWSQILSDVTGKPIRVPVVKEATALACAFAAGVGAGVYASLEEAGKNLVKWEREHMPDMENNALYKEVRQKWEAAYAAQLGLVDAGVTTSMWKAPGL